MAEITGTYARTGAGLEADHQRILTELNRRRGLIAAAVGQLEVNSTKLVRMLVLDPDQVLAPVEPAELVMRLLCDEVPLDEMIIQGLHGRPELASAQEQVQATLMRLKQARFARWSRAWPSAMRAEGSEADKTAFSAISARAATRRLACSGSCKTSGLLM